jgi:hypothetical protein
VELSTFQVGSRSATPHTAATSRTSGSMRCCAPSALCSGTGTVVGEGVLELYNRAIDDNKIEKF